MLEREREIERDIEVLLYSVITYCGRAGVVSSVGSRSYHSRKLPPTSDRVSVKFEFCYLIPPSSFP